jgi:hypothetical protein
MQDTFPGICRWEQNTPVERKEVDNENVGLIHVDEFWCPAFVSLVMKLQFP